MVVTNSSFHFLPTDLTAIVDWFHWPTPVSVFYAVYHQVCGSWCEQRDAKYDGELSITNYQIFQVKGFFFDMPHGQIFWVESFFLRFTETNDINVHLDIWEYLSVLALGWRALKTPTSETPDSEVTWPHSHDPTHASTPLAQTPWGSTGRTWLQARTQWVVIVVLPSLNSLRIDSRNDLLSLISANLYIDGLAGIVYY